MLKNTMEYIKEQIEEKGMEKGQILIDFANICEEKEVVLASKELGYEAEQAQSAEGSLSNWWIYKNL